MSIGYYYFHQNALNLRLTDLIGDNDLGELLSILGDIELKDVVSEKFLLLCQDIIGPQIQIIVDNLKQAYSEVQLIEAVRANSQRLYTNQSQGNAFNKLLLNLGQAWDKFQQVDEYGFSSQCFVEKWLDKFSIGNSISICRVKGIATEVVIKRDNQKVDLIDLGYGVTQFLPILLFVASNLEPQGKSRYLETLGYRQDSSNIVIPLLLIEEPESNLHPKLQSLLADFFIDVAKSFHVTLLIETHSEYLIRRLQVLTAAGQVKSEYTVIYYLDGNLSSESDKFVRKININPDGSLTNDFGPGFIDEATNWKMELMRLKNAQLQNLN